MDRNELEKAHDQPFAADVPASQLRARRFRARTVMFPLLFLFLHWLAINMTAAFYLVMHTLLNSQTMNPMEVFGNLEKMNQLLIEHYPVISALYATLLIPVYLVFLLYQRKKDSRMLWLERASASEIFSSLAITVGLLGIVNIWFILLMRLSESSRLVDRLMTEYIETAGAFSPAAGYFWLILGVSILTPIAEELLFRGIIQGELRRVLPEWAAIIIQAVVFAAFHWQPVQISYVLLPGLLLGVLYAWTRSIWVPIVMHIAFNFLGSVLPALVGEDEVLSQIVGTSQLAFILIGILCLVYLGRHAAARHRRIAGSTT